MDVFCKKGDALFEKEYPEGNAYQAKMEQVPEFGIRMVKAWRITDSEYEVFTVIYNKTNRDYATTEWTCTFANKGVKVHEEKIKVDNVRANSRVIARHKVLYAGNATRVDCV